MSAKVIHCTRCAKALRDPSARLYSHHTKLYFCTNIDACTRRCKRNSRKAVA